MIEDKEINNLIRRKCKGKEFLRLLETFFKKKIEEPTLEVMIQNNIK